MEQSVIATYLEEERSALAGIWSGVPKDLRDAVIFRLAILRFYQDLRWELLATRVLGPRVESLIVDIPPLIYLEPQETFYSKVDIDEGTALFSSGQEILVVDNACMLPIRQIDVQLDSSQNEVSFEIQLHKNSEVKELRFIVLVESSKDWEWVHALQNMTQMDFEWTDAQGNERLRILPREKCWILSRLQPVLWNRMAKRDINYRTEFHYRLPLDCILWQSLRMTLHFNQIPSTRFPSLRWNYLRAQLVSREVIPWRAHKGYGNITLPDGHIGWGVEAIHRCQDENRFMKKLNGIRMHELGKNLYYMDTLEESLNGDYLLDVLIENNQRSYTHWNYSGLNSLRFTMIGDVLEGEKGLQGAQLFDEIIKQVQVPNGLKSSSKEFIAWNDRLTRIQEQND